MEHVVGIGEFAVSGNQGDIIKTFALSTCVGMVFYSLRKRVMGMSHIQLPSSRAMHGGDKLSRFADTAPEHLFKEMSGKFGVTKGELVISLYGGIDGRGEMDCFKIGEKNLATVKASLKSLGMVYSEVDTGGADSRTLVAHVSSGIVEVVKRPMIGQARPGPARPAPSGSKGGFQSGFMAGRR
jgi:chemotaxis protein CheD